MSINGRLKLAVPTYLWLKAVLKVKDSLRAPHLCSERRPSATLWGAQARQYGWGTEYPVKG